jgi:hypothetical protein
MVQIEASHFWGSILIQSDPVDPGKRRHTEPRQKADDASCPQRTLLCYPDFIPFCLRSSPLSRQESYKPPGKAGSSARLLCVVRRHGQRVHRPSLRGQILVLEDAGCVLLQRWRCDLVLCRYSWQDQKSMSGPVVVPSGDNEFKHELIEVETSLAWHVKEVVVGRGKTRKCLLQGVGKVASRLRSLLPNPSDA